MGLCPKHACSDPGASVSFSSVLVLEVPDSLAEYIDFSKPLARVASNPQEAWGDSFAYIVPAESYQQVANVDTPAELGKPTDSQAMAWLPSAALLTVLMLLGRKSVFCGGSSPHL